MADTIETLRASIDTLAAQVQTFMDRAGPIITAHEQSVMPDLGAQQGSPPGAYPVTPPVQPQPVPPSLPQTASPPVVGTTVPPPGP